MPDAEFLTTFPTLQALREKLETVQSVYDIPLQFDGCPCFDLVAGNTYFEGHCWRVCSQCEYCGLHYSGSDPPSEQRAVAERLKHLLDTMDWYGMWALRPGRRRPLPVLRDGQK